MVKIKETLQLRIFAALRVPLIGYLRPTIEELNAERASIKVPLGRRSKNPLNTMFFGALMTGAEIAAGVAMWKAIQATKYQVTEIVKSVHADFLKRAEGDVVFTCESVQDLHAGVREALETGKRVNRTVVVVATVPSKLRAEPVARFTLEISFRKLAKA